MSSMVSFKSWEPQLSSYTPFHFSFTVPLKGTESVISSDPSCKDGNARFTTEPCILSFSWLKVFNSDNFFYFFLLSRNAQVTFCRETLNDQKQFKGKKHGYLIHTWLDKAFKGSLVNRALPSLHGGSI